MVYLFTGCYICSLTLPLIFQVNQLEKRVSTLKSENESLVRKLAYVTISNLTEIF